MGGGRYRSTVLDSDGYLIACHCYIEANPLRARMAAHAAEYPWSSYRHNALGEPDPLVSEHSVYCMLGATAEARQAQYRKLFDEGLDEDMLRVSRDATQQGWIPGSDKFRIEIEAVIGRATNPPRRGRPPKASARRPNNRRSFPKPSGEQDK